MKTGLLKFARKHLYEYDGIWMVKGITFFPLFTFLLCVELNHRRFCTKDNNKHKKHTTIH